MSNTDNNWANPTPAGLIALAVATFVFFAMLSGLVDASARLYAGVWLLGGFIVQLVVGLVDLKHKNMTGGNTFLFFSAFFMFASGIMLILKWYNDEMGITADPTIDGFAWIALTAALILWTPAFFKTNALLALTVMSLDFGLVFITLTDLGLISGVSMIPAAAMLVSGCLGVYLASAMIVNNAFGKKVYPLPGPFIK